MLLGRFVGVLSFEEAAGAVHLTLKLKIAVPGWVAALVDVNLHLHINTHIIMYMHIHRYTNIYM